ncbi:hypothetical protein IFM61606_07951 [Aspergillus udagawae]|uniref:Ca2+-modulated nonselective cation channel polycystin n=1 Tax=Aspergillus udagawae TaxID=91492 RepID=A0A8H3P2Q4_9EURO|nr:hypothetical protein IFM46972_05297 [Aspergillus udagawae]GFF42370.1 hypothetical protein IFM51744_05118 [Aspergillus udagawae]GFF92732.1 hypothetical protein IFM53868_06945 [Aspergillus udagawae]GFG27886.1 hypothetical protein IFM61606_07951 [Aspergillus udagawae]
MATAEVPTRSHVRSGRRHPFSSWMKRLASLKGSSTDSSTIRWSHKRHDSHKNKRNNTKNNPYPLSGTTNVAGEYSSDFVSSVSDTDAANGPRSCSYSEPSIACSGYDNQVPATSAKSTAPTISTNGDTAISEAAYSKAGTMATAGGGISSRGGGEGSTFSSPAPSVRSLTTTLTTVQSAAPSTHFYNVQSTHQGLAHANSTHSTANQQVQFSQPFPSSPATAVPSHLAPHGQPHTYSTATANNILTDNASILTLASSSKRRRRNSLDTNASVRALAPSSVFGGSRESLPLSVLSANVGEPSNTSTFNTPGILNRPSMVGLASAERISVYSASGAIASGERASYHNKPNPGTGDGASVKSAAYSHSRNDSYAASISGGMGVAIASGSVSQPMTGRVSRRSSGWGEINGDEGDQEKEDKEERPAGLKEEDSFDAMPEGTTETTTTATTKN